MLTHLYTETIRTGRVPLTVDVYQDHRTPPFGENAVSIAGGTPERLELGPGNVIRIEDVRADYGVTIRASYAELQVLDGRHFVETLSSLEDPDLLWRISWPAHVTESGASVSAGIWYGQLSETTLKRPIAKLVYPDRPLTIRLWDRLGVLAGQVATPAVEWSTFLHWLSYVKQQISRHLPMVYCPDAWPGGTASVEVVMDPRMIRFASEPAGDPERGDYGKLGDQVERTLAPNGLILFQNTSTSADPAGPGPALYCVHRQYLGRQIGIPPALHFEATRLSTGPRIPATTQPVVISEDVVAVEDEDFLLDDTLDTVDALGAIRLTGDYDGNMVRPPWPDPRHMETGDVQTQVLGRVRPSASVFLQLEVATHATSARSQPDTELFMTGDSGTVYYLHSNGSWNTQASHLTGTGTRTAVEDLPEAGILTVRAIGRGFGHTQSRYDFVGVRFIDEDGRVVTDWVVYAGPDRIGEIISLDRGPLFQRRATGGGWANVPHWDSRLVYREEENVPRRFVTLGDYRAFDRISQQAQDLLAPKGTVAGLIGPGTRLVYEGRDYVMGGGLDLDLDTSQTSGGWVEQTIHSIEEVPS